ncbi:uncharacterized protein [Triticum aestivum]|uniref:uncharacterized protein n=1 Tax=Triticum aestivum TaxID=4565 RepID=UPI001D0118BF|nr:uncharacterized protein LOC123098510 [Triticum aestivum]
MVAKHLCVNWGGLVAEPGGGGVLLNVVCSLQVEESWVDMARYVGLVAVEAQPLVATLELLGRGEPAERACRSCGEGRRESLGRPTLRGNFRPGWRPSGPGRWRLLDGHRATLERAGVVHGRLEVLSPVHLHVHADVVRYAADEELSPLTSRNAGGVARQCPKAAGEVLHRGEERKTPKLRQTAPAYRRTEAQEAQIAEALPWWHATLVLFEDVVPRLRGSPEMIRGDPGAVGRERALSPEKLVALVEPIQEVDGAVVGRKLQLGESRRRLDVDDGRVLLVNMEQRG